MSMVEGMSIGEVMSTGEVIRAGEDMSVNGNIPVISFIGWSGAGKTTLVERLIPELRSRGIRVALLKQDGHEFDMDKEGKDTWRYSKAGADIVTIANKQHAAVLINRPVSIDELIEGIHGVDIILTEGYHELHFPQIEVHRAVFDRLRNVNADCLRAVVTDERLELGSEVRQLGFEDIGRIADCVLDIAQIIIKSKGDRI